MRNERNIDPILGIIELVLLFSLGIFGNKIADVLSIPPNSLFLLTAFLLVILSAVSYAKTARISVGDGYSLKRYLPKTMLGIFPIGILLGFLVGAISTMVASSGNALVMPAWLSRPFTFFTYGSTYLTQAEFFGVFVGVLICSLIAFFVDSYLAASLSLGYGFAFPAALLFVEQEHDVFFTYFGHISFFLLLAIVLIILTPSIRRAGTYLRNAMTEQRI